MDTQDIRRIAHLARLGVTEEGLDELRDQFERVVSYVGQLGEVDTEGVEPMGHATAAVNVFRDDELRESLPHETALAAAPDREGPCFRVPRTVASS